MAGTTKQTNAKATVKLPRAKGKDARQEEFFSVNFKNYIIQRGVHVEVPAELAEAIENAEKAEEYALQYAESRAVKEPTAN